MNRLKLIPVAALAFGSLLGAPAFAQSPQAPTQQANIDMYVDLLRQDVQSQKVAITSQLMNFSPEEAATFWPIYNEYSKELAKLGDEKLAGIVEYAANYGFVSDEKADQIAVMAIDLEGRRVEVKRKYYAKVKAAIGGVLAARFLQIENQLQFIVDLQIASSLPIVE